MPSKKNQSAVGQMIQRCHKWRQKRKQLIDQARQTNDEIERERLLQAAEHYCRMVNSEQGKIDSTRDPKDKTPTPDDMGEESENSDATETADTTESGDDEDTELPEFITNLK